MGVDVVYTRLNTAYKGVATNPAVIYNPGSGIFSAMDDQSTVSGIFRVQYNISASNEGPSVVFGR